MKKLKTSVIILLTIIMSYALSSCSFFGSTGIVGTWNLDNITNDGILKTVEELGYSQIFTLNEDGSFKRTKDGVTTGEGSYTYNTSDGYLKLTPADTWSGDISLGSGTSSVIDDVFDRGYHDSVTDSNVIEIYSRSD